MVKKILRVLVVEDDPLCQKATKKLLQEHYHCHVDITKSATDALERIYDRAFEWRETGYDLILMDIYLPDINGDALTEIIRKTEAQAKSVPVIAVSGRATQRDKKIFQDMGITDLILKPLNFEKLHTMLQEYMDIDKYLLKK